MDVIPGFAPGIVRDNNDPEGSGRIKVEIPGVLSITPYWVVPFNFPMKRKHEGAQYPPPEPGEHVAVIWEYGKWKAPDSRALYLTGYYGRSESGWNAGPTIISGAPTAKAARDRVCLWESAKMIAYIEEDKEADTSRFTLMCKTSGSKIEVDAAGGASKKAEDIIIEARSRLSIYAKGLIDIQADGKVQIQGREVTDHRGRSRPRGI